MQMYRIVSVTHSSLPYIKNLYESSFPLAERREWKQLCALLSEPEMELLLVKVENACVGCIILWRFDTWIYIEHLAIDTSLRGKGYGGKIIAKLSEQNNLVLETSLPKNSISKRRIQFYERLNFKTALYAYSQPPYRFGEQPIPMQLMSLLSFNSPAEFNLIVNMIKEKVYERFYF